MKLRIAELHYQRMRDILALSFRDTKRSRPETGCILIVARNDHPSNPSLLVADVLEPVAGDFDRQDEGALSFSSGYLRRALLAVRRRGLAGFLTVHTHPLSDRKVGFSRYDDASDPELMANLYDLEPGGTFGSVVFGKNSVKARLWNPELRPQDMDEMLVIGSRYVAVPLDGVGDERVPEPAATFDRGLAITGAGALYQMSRMRFGVIGVSGTGSLLIELLVRAGAGTIVMFEFESIDDVNLNRILHSRQSDVDERVSKTTRAAEAIHTTGLPTRVEIVRGGDITDPSVAQELMGCDVLFGCVDREWPRLILSEVAYQYLIPVIDMGTEIGLAADGQELQSLDARVSYVAPGNACLQCMGLVTSEGLRLEGISAEELERTIGLGYCRDIRLKAPAVMDLNMRAASLAMLLLRHLLQPFMATPLPASIRESLTNFAIKSRHEICNPDCLICSYPERLGAGARYKVTTREQHRAQDDAADECLNLTSQNLFQTSTEFFVRNQHILPQIS
jgi:molybdopterin/thiamine biosynthesis adenylyltransferase